MREIKFRAWDECNKVMHNDFKFINSGDDGNDLIIFISDKLPLENHVTNPFQNPNPYFSQQLKKMQYTGLKDKNGKEIYEGDIVIGDGRGTLDEIIFITGCFVLKNAVMYYEASYWGDEIEVVGNIYENKELLNGKG
jgi:uncharacterized phage protein (TIGR01671 family)